MAIALIDHVGSAGAPNGSDTSGNSKTTDSSAKLIVIHVAYDGASNFTQTPFDNKSNIYTSRQRQRDNDNVSAIFDCANPTVGSGHYFSISAAGSYSSVQVAWFSGVDTTPFDVALGSTNNGSTVTTGSITPGAAGELVVTGVATDGGSSYSATSTSGNTFTVTDSNAFASATCYGAALAYTIQTGGSAVAESVTWSGGSSLSAATIAAYKAAASGGTHTTSGGLTAGAATIAGTATHLTLHATSGGMTAGSATIAGTATHPHTTSGGLTGGAATIAGTAAHTAAAGSHDATGGPAGSAATIAGTAAHLTLHTTSGGLVADAATISGSAAHLTLHTSSGGMVASAASISGIAFPGDTPPSSGGADGGGSRKRRRLYLGTPSKKLDPPPSAAVAPPPAAAAPVPQVTANTAAAAVAPKPAVAEALAALAPPKSKAAKPDRALERLEAALQAAEVEIRATAEQRAREIEEEDEAAAIQAAILLLAA